MPHGWDLILPSHAKINIGLYVLRKRQDGYHDIWTIFQELEFHDTLYFRRQQDKSTITTDHPTLPVGEDNLVYRALQMVTEVAGCAAHVAIHIQKRIPLSAGLGGGSSNAATTLIGLKRLLRLDLSWEELMSLGTELGSDVPFFLQGGTALGTGRGENIQPLEDFPNAWILLVNPGISVSSAWAYKNVNLKLTNSEEIINVLPQLDEFTITGVRRFPMENMLEEPVIKEYPVIGSIKIHMLKCGAEWALMSGSGSTVFGVFQSKELAQEALRQIKRSGWMTLVTDLNPRKRVC